MIIVCLVIHHVQRSADGATTPEHHPVVHPVHSTRHALQQYTDDRGVGRHSGRHRVHPVFSRRRG